MCGVACASVRAWRLLRCISEAQWWLCARRLRGTAGPAPPAQLPRTGGHCGHCDVAPTHLRGAFGVTPLPRSLRESQALVGGGRGALQVMAGAWRGSWRA